MAPTEDPPARRRGRPPGRAVHPRPAQLAVADQAARRRDRRRARSLGQIAELRPDVVLVDALLQGRVKGLKLVEQIHEAELGVPVIVLTVPQNPVEVDPATAIHGVLSMPFSGFDLITRIAAGHARTSQPRPGDDRRPG